MNVVNDRAMSYERLRRTYHDFVNTHCTECRIWTAAYETVVIRSDRTNKRFLVPETPWYRQRLGRATSRRQNNHTLVF
jgi:hypothetical protein